MKNITKLFFISVLLLVVNSTKVFAQALNFGAYSYITIGTVLADNHSYTKEAWVKVYPTKAIHGRNFISSYDHPFWLENGVLCAANRYGSYPHTATVQDTQSFPLNAWVHVAVTYDANTAIMVLYRNGKAVAVDSTAPAYSMGVMQLGASGSGDFLDGTDMDEVRIWGVARTQAQLQADMNCDVKGKEGLLAYYKFDEGKPNGKNLGIPSAVDYSGKAFSGLFSNFTFMGKANNYVKGHTINFIAPIAGPTAGCIGMPVMLTDATTGGSWSNGNHAVATISPEGALTGVSVGSSMITYSTANGCSTTKLLSVYTSPTVSATTTSEGSDGGSNGSITTTVSGGRPSYDYAWSTGATTPVLTDLKEGQYSVIVTDAHGCTASGAYIITRPAEANYSINIPSENKPFTAAKQP